MDPVEAALVGGKRSGHERIGWLEVDTSDERIELPGPCRSEEKIGQDGGRPRARGGDST